MSALTARFAAFDPYPRPLHSFSHRNLYGPSRPLSNNFPSFTNSFQPQYLGSPRAPRQLQDALSAQSRLPNSQTPEYLPFGLMPSGQPRPAQSQPVSSESMSASKSEPGDAIPPAPTLTAPVSGESGPDSSGVPGMPDRVYISPSGPDMLAQADQVLADFDLRPQHPSRSHLSRKIIYGDPLLASPLPAEIRNMIYEYSRPPLRQPPYELDARCLGCYVWDKPCVQKENGTRILTKFGQPWCAECRKNNTSRCFPATPEDRARLTRRCVVCVADHTSGHDCTPEHISPCPRCQRLKLDFMCVRGPVDVNEVHKFISLGRAVTAANWEAFVRRFL
jgi:hypothetical protein